ncbi:hypothetical protein Avbf_01513 [Armadillidium vulgare]|nr:hypothetical protein Avbf_01513 [Armadillidium vulgare]
MFKCVCVYVCRYSLIISNISPVYGREEAEDTLRIYKTREEPPIKKQNTEQYSRLILSNGIQGHDRKFALRTLRDFGLGKTPILDEIILTEARSLIKDLRQNVDKPIEIEWNINVAVLNVIFSLLASRRFNVNNEEIKNFAKDLNENVEDMEGPLALFSVFPWMISIVPKYVKDKWMRQARIDRKKR